MGPAGFKLLRYLYENKDQTVTAIEIERRLRIDFYTVKGLIDVLQSQGLVEDSSQGTAAKISPKGITEFRLYH